MNNLNLEIEKNFFTSIISALLSLRPGAQFVVRGTSYDGIEWNEPPVWEGGQKKPTREEVEEEVARLQKEWEDNIYKKLRAPEYPPITDYLDACYWASKGDTTKLDEYYSKCEEVKLKYPKLQ
jgi:hypothetical protein